MVRGFRQHPLVSILPAASWGIGETNQKQGRRFSFCGGTSILFRLAGYGHVTAAID